MREVDYEYTLFQPDMNLWVGVQKDITGSVVALSERTPDLNKVLDWIKLKEKENIQ